MRKLLTAVAALGALALSAVSASAVTTVPITDGGTYTLAYETVFKGGSTGLPGGPGSATFGFVVPASISGHVSSGYTANASPLGTISNLFVGWFADSAGTSLLQTVFNPGASFAGTAAGTVESVFAQGSTRYLIARWTDASGSPDVDVRVAAVPLPAGFLLMGTALAGLGAVRRRRKANAA